jgi:hypothetical protein
MSDRGSKAELFRSFGALPVLTRSGRQVNVLPFAACSWEEIYETAGISFIRGRPEAVLDCRQDADLGSSLNEPNLNRYDTLSWHRGGNETA